MSQQIARMLPLIIAFAILTGCSSNKTEPKQSTEGMTASPKTSVKNINAEIKVNSNKTEPTQSTGAKASPTVPAKKPEIKVVAEPKSMTVLVNKQNSLPSDYEPADLVYPDVPFVFSEKIEKRKMRKEAADALEKLFAAAKNDGIDLEGVSAYRSFETQKSLFQRYVQKDGVEKTKTYSAMPGTSEHETGLAIDVTGNDGKCAAEDCFGSTQEAKWLEQHATEYGFIIRYPKGKESITGYQYEPWHIRFVGKALSKELGAKGITLEEYFNVVSVKSNSPSVTK